MKEFDTTNNQILDELIRRILQVVQPKRLILFGSAARGEMSSESDLDVLVVMPDGIHRRRTAQTIYRNLSGLGVTKDILVVTETDVKKHGENTSLALYPALREGKELYYATG
ncbi:MAG: nucleotidyltransferase domain-containing protein [Proteobacteria bacterium]|nr:nucleotidyltransferase domain-containing protein [Pseudomonadota bacterium]